MLAIDAGATGVTAVVVAADGAPTARAHQRLEQHGRPGSAPVPDDLWRATLAATRQVLGSVDASTLRGIGVTNRSGSVLLWDRETLGSPRPVIPGDGRSLAGVAAREPHTWALVEAGRYAVGTVDSYLVARMTRGTWHLTDVGNASGTRLLDLDTADWSDELCAGAGVPRDALPELVPSWGEVAVTDRAAYCGLSLPVTGIAAGEQAALFGQACFGTGEGRGTVGDGSRSLVNTGTAGHRTTLAWRSPEGVVTGAASGPDGVASLRVDGAGAADDRLCQELADRTGVPVERPHDLEAAARGAAHLAGLGAGVWASTERLRALWRLDRRFDPRRD